MRALLNVARRGYDESKGGSDRDGGTGRIGSASACVLSLGLDLEAPITTGRMTEPVAHPALARGVPGTREVPCLFAYASVSLSTPSVFSLAPRIPLKLTLG